MHSSLARDLSTQSERDLRDAMKEDPVKAKDARLRYIQVTPYFDIDKCWSTKNPTVGFPHYNGF
ncbi:MAG: hypothetical protein ACO35C_04365 [Pontimonas sp.]